MVRHATGTESRVGQDGSKFRDVASTIDLTAISSEGDGDAMLAMLAEMVAQDAQFIIATHSPIVLAFPGARIYNFDATPVREVAYEDLDHVRLTRDFLNAPERYLKRIL